MSNQITIKLGEHEMIPGSDKKNILIMYSGMVNSDVFTIHTQLSIGLHSLYYPITSESITLHGSVFKVIKVDSSQIIVELKQ